MPTPRIYTDTPLAPGTEVRLEPGPSHHLVRVLRLSTGADLTLFSGDGHDYPATLVHADQRAARARVLSRSEAEPAPPLEITLGIGISKGERMDFVVQKGVELGVWAIHPLFCGRSVVQLKGERLARKVTHWRGVALAACEQSGRRRVADIAEPVPLAGWLGQSDSPGETRLMLDPLGDSSLTELPHPRDKIRLLVGPEGGFTERELAAARERGFTGIRLGPRVLRTETAPLAAIAAIQALWGDLR